MPYTFQPGSMYRMPTHFGPRTGPRQGPDGGTFANVDTPKNTTVSVSFLTDADALEAMLPECFTRDGDPVVTVFAKYMTQIEWLAGRGYNVLGVSFPAAFAGAADQVRGPFLTVLWENLTDPILTGREELGFAKIYCELPEPTVLRGAWHCTAAWLGFKFLDLHVTDLQTPDPDATPSDPNDGTLHFKYIPKTGDWGSADVAYPVFTPATGSNERVLEHWSGQGSIQFHRAAWEDMPTQYIIVNAFAALPIVEYCNASVTKSVGAKDLSDQRILH